MARISGVNTKISGKVGEYIYRQTKFGTIVSEAPSKPSTPRRSEKQMSTRTQWANLGATYKLFDDMLKRGFEGDGSVRSSYNSFVQANLGVVKVYITKQMRLNGGCLLAPYQVTRGSLPSIGMMLNGSGIVVSNLGLGSLAINAQTTVAQFSEAILANNKGWEETDQLTFFHGMQTFDAVTNIPRASITGYKVVIDTADDTPLWDVVSPLGFTSASSAQAGPYVLGMDSVLLNGAAVWVHTREEVTGQLRVSTQYFYVENAALASYMTLDALVRSANSYGGVNSKAVYLQPSSGMTAFAGASSQASQQQATGGSGSGTGGSGTGGSGTGTGNGSGSGSGGGSETPTVAAPTISGSTPFEESTTVTMSGPSGATIHYTTDGTNPTASSTAYTEAITLSDTTTVKAVAVKDGVTSSVTSRTFTKGSGGGETETE